MLVADVYNHSITKLPLQIISFNKLLHEEKAMELFPSL